jgi:BCD family chlorophyll transporter-like MFS transporter
MNQASTGYGVVYHLEILLLFATLVAIGPLVRTARRPNEKTSQRKFGLAEFPG